MSDYTQGRVVRDTASGLTCDIRHESGRAMALCWGLSTSKAARENSPKYRAQCDAIANRFVACWNACEGISTEELAREDGHYMAMVRERLGAKQHIRDQAERIRQLEAELEAVGAGGVQPLKPVAANTDTLNALVAADEALEALQDHVETLPHELAHQVENARLLVSAALAGVGDVRPVAPFCQNLSIDPCKFTGLCVHCAPTAQAAPALHPKTADLVQRFSAALAEKLAAAEKKYGYSDGWASPDWMDECRQHLNAHIAKGDPRDVAAYCAFLWHHGASTAAPAAGAAAPQGGAYAELPTPHGKNAGEPFHYTADQMRDFADRTHARRASHGQAPAATVIKKGADRQWMSERLGHLPDGIYSLYLAPTAQPAPAATPQADSQPAPTGRIAELEDALSSCLQLVNQLNEHHIPDGCSRLIRHIKDAAATVSNAQARAPADSVTAPAAGAVAGPVLCVSSRAFKRMKAGDDSIKAWLPPATEAEDMLLYAAAPTPATP